MSYETVVPSLWARDRDEGISGASGFVPSQEVQASLASKYQASVRDVRAMTQPERNHLYALLMLRWSRTIESHRIYPFEVWLKQRPLAPNS